MRASIGLLGGITVLFVGFYGLSEQAQQTQDAAVTNGTNSTASAFNSTSTVFDGIGQAFGPGIVWMGVAALILIALGFLLAAGRNGR